MALLSVFTYYLGVFAIGAYLGATVGLALSTLIAPTLMNSSLMWFLLAGLSVADGVMAVIFHRFMIILSSSFAGAWILLTGVSIAIVYLSRTYPGEVFSYVMLASRIVLGAVGMIVQFKVTAKKKLAEERRKAEKNS